jgi:hypothetical protein
VCNDIVAKHFGDNQFLHPIHHSPQGMILMSQFEGKPELACISCVVLANILNVSRVDVLCKDQADRKIVLLKGDLDLCKLDFFLIGFKEVYHTGQAEVNVEDPAPVQVIGARTWSFKLIDSTRLKGWLENSGVEESAAALEG